MNKKFSTLMAGLMLASAFSVASAQNPSGKYEDGKYYLLNGGGNGYFLSVVSTPGDNYGQLTSSPLNYDGGDVSLKETREALWQVKVNKANLGNTPSYQFVNVATGQILSVSVPDGTTPVLVEKLAGSNMEWYNGLSSTNITAANPFFSYVDNGKNVIYLSSTGNVLAGTSNRYSLNVTKCDAANIASVGNAITVRPYIADVVALGADELNKELIVNNDDDDDASFTLSFNRDVTEGAAENLFAATALQAENVGTTGYVKLHVKGDKSKYIVVDTTLHAGSEAERQLPKFAYDDPTKEAVDGNNVARLPESFNFKFAYDPTNNRVLIKSEKYVKKITPDQNNGKPVTVKGEDGNNAYTYWPTTNAIDASGVTATFVEDAYIRLVELSNVRELTVASAEVTEVSPWYSTYQTVSPYTVELGADDLTNGMLTTVTIGKGLMSYVPTTIPTGLYTIQYKGSNEDEKATDNYYIANLGGAFGYAEQAKNQLYDHMPAAQWYVKQNGDIATAPVTITNREFSDLSDNANYQNLQAFQAEDGSVFFLGGAFAQDTLKFIPVSDASKADSLLGYKHVDEEQASVETYVFNYLHGLSKDNGLNTPSDKDSLVRVDETGEKVAFRLIPVVSHDSYGMQLSAADVKATGIANLIRNAYYVEAYDNLKFAEDGENRYLTYDEATKKYVMSKSPTAYFLKENNCIDGNHYYALVEANVLNTSLSSLNRKAGLKFYAPEFAGMSVKDEKVKSYSDIYTSLTGADRTNYLNKTLFFPLDKNGKLVITDNSKVALYAYQSDGEKVVLKRIGKDVSGTMNYAYINLGTAAGINFGNYDSDDYASSRVSVDDNTLDLTNAVLSDKFTGYQRRSAVSSLQWC